MKKAIRKAVKAVARISGYEIDAYQDVATYRLHFTKIKNNPPLVLRPLLSDPVDALHYTHGQKPASFDCRIDRCVDLNGLNFREHGWHPFTAALAEYANGTVTQYEGSSLEGYYERWQPASMRDALFGLSHSDDSELRELPAHLVGFFPWCARTVEEADEGVRYGCHRDSEEHGSPHLSVDQDGFKTHGPMSQEAGRFEYARLIRVYESLVANGYRREHGDIGILMVRRGGEHRFIVYNGIHRVAAMKVLGYATVPAMFSFATVFDVAEAERWPQVSRGVWSRMMAENYINHLFDFDSHGWAAKTGLA